MHIQEDSHPVFWGEYTPQTILFLVSSFGSVAGSIFRKYPGPHQLQVIRGLVTLSHMALVDTLSRGNDGRSDCKRIRRLPASVAKGRQMWRSLLCMMECAAKQQESSRGSLLAACQDEDDVESSNFQTGDYKELTAKPFSPWRQSTRQKLLETCASCVQTPVFPRTRQCPWSFQKQPSALIWHGLDQPFGRLPQTPNAPSEPYPFRAPTHQRHTRLGRRFHCHAWCFGSRQPSRRLLLLCLNPVAREVTDQLAAVNMDDCFYIPPFAFPAATVNRPLYTLDKITSNSVTKPLTQSVVALKGGNLVPFLFFTRLAPFSRRLSNCRIFLILFEVQVN